MNADKTSSVFPPKTPTPDIAPPASIVANSQQNWSKRLIETAKQGQEQLPPVSGVSKRSALLCGALSELALSAYVAVGGNKESDRIREAAMALALLTKIDDEVIDDIKFHKGMSTDRNALRVQTRRYLAPTLAAIRGVVHGSSERVQLAARLGKSLRSLSAYPERLEHLYRIIDRGWETQVDAVAAFTAHPSCVCEDEIERVTAAISRDWLLMITLIGFLPMDAQRGISDAEENAFSEWGKHIQSVDALTDLKKDLADGHYGTLPGVRAWHTLGDTYLRAAMQDSSEVYRQIAYHEIDLSLIPDAATLDKLVAQQAELGALPNLLRWIHGFLLYRYTIHPESHRRTFPELIQDTADFQLYLEMVCSAP